LTIGTDEVTEIATIVWSTLLDRDLIPVEAAAGLDPSAGAQVSIEGAFDGRVRVEMALPLARQLAAQMFMLGEDEVDDSLVDDALGELANIIGGNIKALLPSPSKLSLPGPSGGAAGEVLAEVVLACDEHSVVIALERLG
jgi:chemotaxis protein CheX